MTNKAQHEAMTDLENCMETGRNRLEEIEHTLSSGLRQLRATLAKAEQNYGAKHPEVLAMRAEVERGEREAHDQLGQARREIDEAAEEAGRTLRQR